MSPDKSTIGQRIRELRLTRRVDQTRLAQLLGVRPETVSRWENDKNPPDRAALEKIARDLTGSLDWLLTGVGDMLLESQPQPQQVAVDDGTSEDYVRIKISTHEELIHAALEARKVGILAVDEMELVLAYREKS